MRHDRMQNRRRVGKASRFDQDPLKWRDPAIVATA